VLKEGRMDLVTKEITELKMDKLKYKEEVTACK